MRKLSRKGGLFPLGPFRLGPLRLGLLLSALIILFLAAGCSKTDFFDFSFSEGPLDSGGEESLDSSLSSDVSPPSRRGLPDVDDAISALPSVVEIEVSVQPTRWPEDIDRGEFFGHPFESFHESMPVYGAGIVFDSEGHILTNHHLIEGADDVTVKLSGGDSFTAKIIGSDERTDIGVLKITPTEGLTKADIGDSDDLSVGDWVVVLGNPYGLGLSASVGIVSALDRSSLDWETSGKFIQTDAPMNPGNSGGAMVNLDGEVVGIVSAVLSPGEGIGFAIPIKRVVNVATEIIDTGTVERGWLGIKVQVLDSDLAEFFSVDSKEGALVSRVQEGSPAHTAGIREGDVIVGFDGEEVSGMKDLLAMITDAKVGANYKIDIIRDGSPLEIDVEMGNIVSRGDETPKYRKLEPDALGLFTVDAPDELKETLGIDYGVLVTETANADSLEILPGDVIVSINKNPALDRESYLASLNVLSGGDKAVILINRSGNTFFSAVDLRK